MILHSSQIFILLTSSISVVSAHVFSIWEENSVDPDQIASLEAK